jgi:hypothetical protein
MIICDAPVSAALYIDRVAKETGVEYDFILHKESRHAKVGTARETG